MPNNVLEKILIRNQTVYHGTLFTKNPNKKVNLMDTENFAIEDYKPEVLEEMQARFAGHILSTNQIDNLVWAKEFMDAYERKHRKTLAK